MQEQIEKYRQWLSDLLNDYRSDCWEPALLAGYTDAYNKFNELFPTTTCPNCGETSCTEQCEFELERQRATLKADTIAKECNHTIFTDSAGIYCKKCKKRNRDLYITDH
jgi:hypothetical protein